MSRDKRRRKHTVPLTSLMLAGLFIAFCICGAVRTNKNKISPQVETYSEGETVDIGKNFFSDSVEDPSGYTIRVNSAELVSYGTLLTSAACLPDLSCIRQTSQRRPTVIDPCCLYPPCHLSLCGVALILERQYSQPKIISVPSAYIVIF